MKRLFYGLLAAFLMFLPCSGLFAQNRGASLQVRTQSGEQVAQFGEAHALVIGESAYTNGWRRLPGVKEDVTAVRRLFEEIGFHVETIQDANSRDLSNGIKEFLDNYGFNKDARLIIYFAGHGATLTLGTDSKMGYIVPVDAPLPTRDERTFKQRAIAMDQFKSWATTYDACHILFIFDSCFSGTVFRSMGGAPPAINRYISRPVRQFITAGAADEEVPDESVFRKQFVDGLRYGFADLNKDGYISGTELGLYLSDTVANYMNGRQNPQQGKLNDPNLDKGDFIFAVETQAAPPKGPTPVTGGSVTVNSEIAGEIFIDGQATGRKIKAGGSETIHNVSTGNTEVWVKDSGGATVKAPSVMVRQGQTVTAVIERPVPNNMVRIQGGTFTMGSPASEPGRGHNEDQHQVTVSSFYMGKYEVTQKEYQEIMGTNPSNFKGDNLPVESVSWYDAIEYCNKRSQKEGLTPAYIINKNQSDPNNTNSSDTVKWTVTWNKNTNGYRLPTEAEWEYACRAGTMTPFSTGNNITTSQANYDGNRPYNNNAKGTYREKMTPVGSFASNAWGLYDMHGNVREWCWDWFGNYTSGSQTDPVGASSGDGRVDRGGSWSSDSLFLRSARRFAVAPFVRTYNLGFRLVRTL